MDFLEKNKKKIKKKIVMFLIPIAGAFLFLLLVISLIGGLILGSSNGVQSAGENSTSSVNEGEVGINKVFSLLCGNCDVEGAIRDNGVWASSFYKKLSEQMNLYNSLELETERIDEFDFALIAATIGYGKKMQAELFQDSNQFGTWFDEEKLTNKDAYSYPNVEDITIDNAQRFYKWAGIMLGTPFSIPETNLRGLAGNLVTGKVISSCEKGYTTKSKESQTSTLTESIINIEKKFSGEIVKKPGFWDSILSIFGVSYTSDENVINKRVEEFFANLGLPKNADMEAYINLDYYNPELECSRGTGIKNTYLKFMNYEQYKVYLEEVYVPQTYINCDECLSRNSDSYTKDVKTKRIVKEIFELAEFYRDYAQMTKIDYIELLYGDKSLATAIPNLYSPIKSACSITSYYGKRGEIFHNAVDATITSSDKTLYAIANGVVEKVIKYTDETLSYDPNLGYCPAPGNPSAMHPNSNGTEIVIKHEVNGVVYRSRYVHLEKVYVSVGDTVSRGDKVAKMGNTGCSTGTHLHFELTENGVNINPSALFANCNGSEAVGALKIKTTDNFVNPEKCKVGDLTLDEVIAGLIKNSSSGAVNSPEYVKALAIVIRTSLMNETDWCNSDILRNVSVDIENNSNDLLIYSYVIDTQGMVLNYSGEILENMSYSNFPCQTLPSDWQNPGVRSYVLGKLGIADSPDLDIAYVNKKLEEYNSKCVEYSFAGDNVTVHFTTIPEAVNKNPNYNGKYSAIVTIPSSRITSTSEGASGSFSTIAARYYADQGYSYSQILYEFYAVKTQLGDDVIGVVDIVTAPGLLDAKMKPLKSATNVTQGFSHGDILPGTTNVPSGNMSDEELAEINKHLKDYVDKAEQIAIERGDLNPKRVRVMAAAYWLIYNPFYRVQYEFGRPLIQYPYTGVGWDPKWNSVRGIECSNFVLWSFIQAGAPFRDEGDMQHTHETLDNPTGVYLTVEQLLRSGVEPGDVLRKSKPEQGNGHWSIVMTVNPEKCFIEVAHAVNVQEDTKISRYNCGERIYYEHLHKMEVFYQDELWKASVGK